MSNISESESHLLIHVPGHKVVVENTRTGEYQEAIADSDGVVRNADGQSFAPGPYELRVTTVPDPLSYLRRAYSDTFHERDPQERCLSFLMPSWVIGKHANRAAHLIGEYGTFAPSKVTSLIAETVLVDSFAGFALGRENSPVLYIETTETEQVLDIFAESKANELWKLKDDVEHHTVPNARGYDNPHSACRHEEAPTAVEAYAGRREQTPSEYIRVWWDS